MAAERVRVPGDQGRSPERPPASGGRDASGRFRSPAEPDVDGREPVGERLDRRGVEPDDREDAPAFLARAFGDELFDPGAEAADARREDGKRLDRGRRGRASEDDRRGRPPGFDSGFRTPASPARVVGGGEDEPEIEAEQGGRDRGRTGRGPRSGRRYPGLRGKSGGNRGGAPRRRAACPGSVIGDELAARPLLGRSARTRSGRKNNSSARPSPASFPISRRR